jgi:hyperosmotically inducible periplasmic protein
MLTVYSMRACRLSPRVRIIPASVYFELDEERNANPMMKRSVIQVALTALLAAVACSNVVAQTASTNKTIASNEQSTILWREIHHQLAVLPFYSVFDYITFTLKGNNVVLIGQVLRRSLREHAEAVIRSIEGVGTVTNQIEVLPASLSDDDLRNSVYRALYEDSTLARYATENVPPVHIIVKNGAVALEGLVDSLADKNLAGSRAANVSNVQGVRNNLIVHAKESAAK